MRLKKTNVCPSGTFISLASFCFVSSPRPAETTQTTVIQIVFLRSRLEECKLTHEKHITAAAKCKTEIKKMKEEMKQLHDANTYGPICCYRLSLTHYD